MLLIDNLYVNDEGSSDEFDAIEEKEEDQDNLYDTEEDNDSNKCTKQNNKRKLGSSIHAIYKQL